MLGLSEFIQRDIDNLVAIAKRMFQEERHWTSDIITRDIINCLSSYITMIQVPRW